MTNLDQASNHLQFLGYEITDSGESKRARHSQRWNMVFKVYKDGLLFSAYLTGSDHAKQSGNRTEYLELVNALNRAASVTRFYLDDDQDLVMEAVWPGEYERERFGAFMDLWDTDTRSHLIQLESQKFFL